MTITQEMVSVLFEKATIEKVKNQFNSGVEKTPIDRFDMTFRLFKAKPGNINLELMCHDDQGMFFKPIGFYLKESGSIFKSTKFSITILNEFVNDFKSIGVELSSNLDMKFMSIRESGIISAFSRETFQMVQEMYRLKERGLPQSVIDDIGPFPHLHAMQFDKSLTSNGLEIDLLFSFEQVPQCFLNDKYGVQGAIGVYYKDRNGYRLNPVVEYEGIFHKFYSMGLLTALNGF